ncbi:3-hydroxyacyl-CoA dehydrogenase NAD-binding domain-containing protein [Malonomonas rubra]|uniref:3-hydroxyacyl-CoA dehydrogenase NAD-binding domain-containing protein n=1 Tax=Malonomonas rubra TaxID=57040 RepID=UPI0026EA9463|nr:3-hydroxyacyl-CoA dehydrogenase NAD-binding domain-containing protein [Malonomonas rubra]
MTNDTTFRHWHWSLDRDEIFHLTLDRADSPQNSLSQAVLLELEEVICLLQELRPQAVVLRSGKPKSFIVGADVSEFSNFTEPAKVLPQILKAQEIFFRLEHLPMPVIAVIDGPCLGGGLELALACRYRIAVDDRATNLGFPEVQLGIHPGFGGTVRSIRQIGTLPALQMMLTGRSSNARQAKQVGLVDEAVPRRVLENAVTTFLQNPPPRKLLPWSVRLGNLAPLRPLLAWILRRKVTARANQKHYPAPYALLDLWRHYAHDSEQMYLEEARSVASLICSSTAQNLVRVFFLQSQLKSHREETALVQRVHVIGAGSMGRDIASWCALQGLQVTLQDLDDKVLAEAIAAADKLFCKKLKKNNLIRAAHDRLMADPQGLGVARADLVIEAIVEKVELKKQLFTSIEPQLRGDAILASNTSSIPLEELAKVLQNPQRFLGIHFFNPVSKMPLVEIVRAEQSAQEPLARATAFVQRIKRLPLPVKSSPGFLVNRILMPYLLAAVELVEEGNKVEDIDRAALDFGMPMGPLELADKVGIDICLSVAEVFADYFQRPVPPILTRMITAGKLGLKSGQGFYAYRKGKKVVRKKRHHGAAQDLLLGRLLDPLLQEAEACLAEGIVESADQVDAGMIFGTGFAPFTGGPLHYKYQAATD